jgi:hypothetical protein
MMNTLKASGRQRGIHSLIKIVIAQLAPRRWLRLTKHAPTLAGGPVSDSLPHVPASFLVPYRDDEYMRMVRQEKHCDGCGLTGIPIIIVQPTWNDTSSFALCKSCQTHHNRLSGEALSNWQLELTRKALERVLRDILEGRTAFRKEK